jgi:hypothetical protein
VVVRSGLAIVLQFAVFSLVRLTHVMALSQISSRMRCIEKKPASRQAFGRMCGHDSCPILLSQHWQFCKFGGERYAYAMYLFMNVFLCITLLTVFYIY